MGMTNLQAVLDAVLSDAVAGGDVAHAAGIVTDADDVLYQGQAGPRRLGDAAPLEPDTVYWIHSMTKPLTACCLMQLVEQGRIGLDDDCGDLLPALRAPKVLEGFSGSGEPVLRPARGKITLRRLLTHTAGFVYDNWNPDQRDWVQWSGRDRADFYKQPALCPPLGHDPGTRWEYGINIDWAAQVLQKVTGESLDAYMQAHVIKPLGMASTGFLLRDDIRARLSGVHERDGAGYIKAVDFPLPDHQEPEDFTGGGGLYGSAPDYARFMRMILNKGELDGVRVLAPETVDLMSQNHIGDLEVGPLPAALPANSYPVDLYPGIEKRWGLSFLIVMDDVPEGRRAGTLSWAGLRNTYFWIDRKTGIGAALFTQMLPFVDPKTLALLDRFEKAIYAELSHQSGT